MSKSPHEQALLANRWMGESNDSMWSEFARYWMAFNSLYSVVQNQGDSETDAIKNVIPAFFDQTQARKCLRDIDPKHVSALFQLPPGDDRYESTDPRYRQKTSRLVAAFHKTNDDVERLTNVVSVVYQVRCNLLHGSKDPAVMRDQELVSACVPILRVLVSHLGAIMEGRH